VVNMRVAIDDHGSLLFAANIRHKARGQNLDMPGRRCHAIDTFKR